MRHAWKDKRENVGITSLTRDNALAFVNTEINKHRDELATMSEGQKNAGAQGMSSAV